MNKYNYHATKEEVIDLINGLDTDTLDGIVSLNEVAKQAYCENICNEVTEMESDDEWERLKAYVNENYSTTVRGSGLELYELLTTPRILSGELDLPQIRDIYNYIKR